MLPQGIALSLESTTIWVPSHLSRTKICILRRPKLTSRGSLYRVAQAQTSSGIKLWRQLMEVRSTSCQSERIHCSISHFVTLVRVSKLWRSSLIARRQLISRCSRTNIMKKHRTEILYESNMQVPHQTRLKDWLKPKIAHLSWSSRSVSPTSRRQITKCARKSRRLGLLSRGWQVLHTTWAKRWDPSTWKKSQITSRV